MTRRAWVALGLLISLVSVSGRADVRFLTHSLSDSTYQDGSGHMRGKAHGGRRAFYVELVAAMMRERGRDSAIEEVPLSRGLFLLERENDFALFNIIRNDERRNRFKWVGPISVFPTYFYEHKDAPTGVQTMADAREVQSICVLRGNNLEQNMRNQGFTNIFLANSVEACVQLLEYKRVPLMAESRYPYFMADPVLAKTLVRTPVVLSVDEGYIAFSPNVPDTEIAAWQAALDALKADGRYGQILADYLLPEGLELDGDAPSASEAAPADPSRD